MHFVKSSVYQAEITEGGVREREVDTRSREEIELQERLRRLPEFSRSKPSARLVSWQLSIDLVFVSSQLATGLLLASYLSVSVHF